MVVCNTEGISEVVKDSGSVGVVEIEEEVSWLVMDPW